MADMQACEQGVVLCIIRKTVGHQKEWDEISLTQFEEATGMNRPSVHKGIQMALARGIIQRRQLKNSFQYCVCEPTQNGSENEPLDSNKTVQNVNRNSSENEPIFGSKNEPCDAIGSENEPKSVQKMNTQKKEEITTTLPNGSDAADRSESPPLTRAGKKPKPPADTDGEPTDTVQQEWFAAICWLVHEHQDYSLLSKVERIAIGKAIKEIRSSKENYTLDDLRRWYKAKWSMEWPGKQRGTNKIQPPTLAQIKTGIGWTRHANKQNGFAAQTSQQSEPAYKRLKQL